MTDELRKTPRKKNRHVSHVCPAHDKLGEASVTYQLEHVKCGKPKCSKWHGPYWYAYWSAGGKTRSLYVGKTLRPAAEVANEKNKRRRQYARAGGSAAWFEKQQAKKTRKKARKGKPRMKQQPLPFEQGHPFTSPYVGGPP